jgi:hypothetical protein
VATFSIGKGELFKLLLTIASSRALAGDAQPGVRIGYRIILVAAQPDPVRAAGRADRADARIAVFDVEPDARRSPRSGLTSEASGPALSGGTGTPLSRPANVGYNRHTKRS